MNKSFHVHYMNKYPGGQVHSSESGLDVFDKNGDHAVALRKNGHGQWVDMSQELGCKDLHDLAPIPKDARKHKLHAAGHIGKDELHEERNGSPFLCAEGRKVLSCAELFEAKRFKFNEKHQIEEAYSAGKKDLQKGSKANPMFG